MNKLVIGSSALLLSLSLVGCQTMNGVNQFGQSTVGVVGNGVKYGVNTVGSGVKYGVNTVGTGVKYGMTTVGNGFGYLANTSVNTGRTVTGVATVPTRALAQPSYQTVNTYHGNKVVYYKGQHYVLKNGQYMLVR